MVKTLLKVLGICAAVIIIIFFRAFIYQYKEFKKGEDAMQQRDLKNAVVYYETAIHMYTPQSPYIKKSVERMLEIAQVFEAQSEHRWALNTYENLRSSLYSVRSFYLPYPEIIALCDKKISELIPKAEK